MPRDNSSQLHFLEFFIGQKFMEGGHFLVHFLLLFLPSAQMTYFPNPTITLQINEGGGIPLLWETLALTLTFTFLKIAGCPKSCECWLDFAIVWLNNIFDVRQMSKTIGRKGMCQRPEKMIKLGDVQQADTSCDQAKKKDVHLIDSSLGRYWF